MPSEAASLKRELRQAGFSARAIDAVWPEWWSREAESSLSAVTELRYTVARRLGLLPGSLLEGRPQFVWRDEAKFKSLTAASDDEQALLTSFGSAFGALLNSAIEIQSVPHDLSPLDLRAAFLRSAPWVGLRELLSFCWGVGIPVVQVHVFPLQQKRMHAMTVRVAGRYAILLGRKSAFPAQAAYTVAHEVSHILLGHIESTTALVDFDDPLTVEGLDGEELGADKFALTVLTGSERPDITPTSELYSGAQLAEAALRSSRDTAIDPGVLILCLGHATGRWRQSMAALKLLHPDPVDTAAIINSIAMHELALDSLSPDTRTYVRRVMDLGDGR